MSGHNKWSTIKHRKGAQDAKRSKIFTKIIKEITVAARLGGGDPDGNPRLRRALDAARDANMPSENVTRAIKKGTGELEGVSYEELLYEGVGPAGTLFLLEVMTDNRNRTAAEIRKLFDKHGGQLGASGSAAWAFEQKGVIEVDGAADEEALFEVAVGAGADDVERVGESWRIKTPRTELETVREAIEEAGMKVNEASLAYLPNTPKEVEGEDAATLIALYEALEDHDDVQGVYADFELSESALSALE
ncbi:MAG: YebC/PmpR family DNA-binding transcriptional regulator [Myxococcales bacterium]|nr:YebC/PmpR family DNA-binding transcriptional regulator [Myxococcales bacterium]